mgnify:FL=1
MLWSIARLLSKHNATVEMVHEMKELLNEEWNLFHVTKCDNRMLAVVS